MEQTEQELFEIKLAASAKPYIRKFAGIAKAMIAIGIFISLTYLTAHIIRIVKTGSTVYKDNLMTLYYRLGPFFTGAYFIFFFIQTYFYWKLSQYLKKGMEYNNDEIFNQSFRALYRHAVASLVCFVISLLMGILDMMVAIKYYLN